MELPTAIEGKAALFKRFGGADAWPVVLDTIAASGNGRRRPERGSGDAGWRTPWCWCAHKVKGK
jgi:hypothetical protein